MWYLIKNKVKFASAFTLLEIKTVTGSQFYAINCLEPSYKSTLRGKRRVEELEINGKINLNAEYRIDLTVLIFMQVKTLNARFRSGPGF
jgi:hypothetical protein